VLKIGSRVINKSGNCSSWESPVWGERRQGKVIGTVVQINKNGTLRVFWDNHIGGLSSRSYCISNQHIVEVKPLMIPLGIEIYLKDYVDFPEHEGIYGTVVLRSARLGVKVKFGRISKYVNINNIVPKSNDIHSSCIYCGEKLVKGKDNIVFLNGFFAHKYCSTKCIHCGLKKDIVVSKDEIHPMRNFCDRCAKKHYYFKCAICKEVQYKDGMLKIHTGEYFCSTCMEEHISNCQHCGEAELKDSLILIGGRKICRGCQRYIQSCSICDDKTVQGSEFDRVIYCPKCRKKHFGDCSRCGRNLPTGSLSDFTLNEEEYKKVCAHCRSRLEEDLYIHRWNYKPNRYYYSKMKYDKNPLYLGLELEVELPNCTAGEGAKETIKAIESFGASKYFYLKQDGSLSRGHSFELVGQPATLAFIGNNYKIYNLLNFFKEKGYDCETTGQCGLHVHVSNKDLSFRDVAKIKMFIWKHKNILDIFGNKTASSQQRYAKYEPYTIKEFKKKYMVNYIHTKYMACNLTNNTLEFRFWKATFDHLRFLATLSFSEAITYYVKDTSLAKIHYGKFGDFVQWLYKSEYYHLVKYFNLLKLSEKEEEYIKNPPKEKKETKKQEAVWDGFVTRRDIRVEVERVEEVGYANPIFVHEEEPCEDEG